MLPPNRLTASEYRQFVEELAAVRGLGCKFLGEKELGKLGAGAFLAVAFARGKEWIGKLYAAVAAAGAGISGGYATLLFAAARYELVSPLGEEADSGLEVPEEPEMGGREEDFHANARAIGDCTSSRPLTHRKVRRSVCAHTPPWLERGG